MKKLLILLLGIGSSKCLSGQGLEKGERLCLQVPSVSTTKTSEAEAIVQNILTKIGKQIPNLRVRECAQTKNAMVACDSSRHLYLLYNQSYLNGLKQNAISKGYPTPAEHQADWVTIGVFAHELGHIVNDHVYNPLTTEALEKESPKRELQADEFVGTTLATLGANLDEARMCIDALQQQEQNSTHPPKARRLQTIEKGWRSKQKPLPLTEASKAFEQKAYEKAYQILSHPAQDLEAMDCWMLGELLRNGWGCPADTLNAMTYFEKALVLDPKDCQSYESLYQMLLHFNPTNAFMALVQGAEQGCLYCQTRLGWQYEWIGQPDSAAQWYQKAAAKEYPAAIHNLGSLYERGSGLPQDLEKAKELYRKAAKWGYKPSQQRLEILTP